jgi:hypothetical protein
MRRLAHPTALPLTTAELAATSPEGDDLAELQLWMTRLLRHGKNLALDPELTEAATRHFGGSSRLSPAEQIEIYREQFWLRHIGSLIEDFPGLCGILGQNDWQRLAESYLGSVVPTSPSLRDLGQDLPRHIAGCDFLPHRELLVDMARLEWAYIEAFDAPEAELLTAERLAAIPGDAWENARFELAPSVRLLRVAYPVSDLRRALRAAGENAEPLPLPERQSLHLVVYRRELKLWDKAIAPLPFELLEALAAGLPLGQAATSVLARFPDAEEELSENIGAWFQRWGKLGWISGVGCDQKTSNGYPPSV